MSSFLIKEKGYRVRYVKSHSFVATANSITSGDWVIPQMQYPDKNNVLQNVESFISGVQYDLKNTHLSDTIRFQFVHPVAGVVDEFGDIFAMEGVHILKTYIASMPAGLTIRVVYENTGNTDTEVKMNVLRHIDTSGVLT
jgi:hypothetical protein